jgi:hypothetical protein
VAQYDHVEDIYRVIHEAAEDPSETLRGAGKKRVTSPITERDGPEHGLAALAVIVGMERS